MQQKNEALKKEIIRAAEREFLVHGFKNGSMRSIAKRAHTSTGNIYRYFSGKEALLAEILSDILPQLHTFVSTHQAYEGHNLFMGPLGFEAATTLLAQFPELFPIDLFLSTPFLIFLGRCEGTPYDEERTKLIQMFEKHLHHHLSPGTSPMMPGILMQSFLNSMIYINMHMASLEEGRKAFSDYIILMSAGFIID